jgi:Gluconate 2-dehydrogenase subunit 3
VPIWLTETEFSTLLAACNILLPPHDDVPGAGDAGAGDYIDTLLGAFSFDPPRIWAGGATSGRAGGAANFSNFHALSALDELAWRTRIEGSQGLPAREFNGPVVGYQQRYREGLGRLGDDFVHCAPDEQETRLRADPDFLELLVGHTCEGMYGAPEYGGNRDLAGWRSIGFAGDVQPRGWTDAEVSTP